MSKSKMFDNYPQPESYIPDNLVRCFPKEEITIMSGETTTHSFEVPLDINKLIDYKALYKLGLEVILDKTRETCDAIYDEERGVSLLTWKLPPEETILFGHTLLDAKVQLRFTLEDGSIAFSDVMSIRLENSLQSIAQPTPPIVNVGFGWTED